MIESSISAALVELGEDLLADAARELRSGGRVVHLQLLASRFYEAVKVELARTPPTDAQTRATLNAVAGQCSRVAGHLGSPHLVIAELRAAVSMLTHGPSGPPRTAVVGPPVLRVIQGGRA